MVVQACYLFNLTRYFIRLLKIHYSICFDTSTILSRHTTIFETIIILDYHLQFIYNNLWKVVKKLCTYNFYFKSEDIEINFITTLEILSFSYYTQILQFKLSILFHKCKSLGIEIQVHRFLSNLINCPTIGFSLCFVSIVRFIFRSRIFFPSILYD